MTNIERINPGDSAQIVADKIYNNDNQLLNSSTGTVFNVSKQENKYDYANKQTARNAIATGYRSLGQIVAYKLSTGKWITEQYTGTDISGWATETNWKSIGGINTEDIAQTISDEKEKPISPFGVKSGLLAVDGIEQKVDTSDYLGNNLATVFEYTTGSMLSFSGGNEVITTTSNWKYLNQYIPIKPNTKYVTNARASTAILFYDANKKATSAISYGLANTLWEFTSPANVAYLRCNAPIEATTNVTVREYIVNALESNDLRVKMLIGDISGATDASGVDAANIIPSNVKFKQGYSLGQWGNEISNAPSYYSLDYIPIKPETNYSYQLGSGTTCTLIIFDSEKNVMGWILGTANTLKTPKYASYFRFITNSLVMANQYVRETGKSGFMIPDLFISSDNIVEPELTTGDPVEVIPYRATTNQNITAPDSWFGYAEQSSIRGKRVVQLKLTTDTAGTFTIGRGASHSNILEQKTFQLVVGLNTLTTDFKLTKTDNLYFKGLWKYYDSATNPIGQGCIGNYTFPNIDLSVGVSILSATLVKYTALGDSITAYYNTNFTYARLVANKMSLLLNNLAVSGMKVIGATGLKTQTVQIPADFKGIVSLMMSTNDYFQGSAIGDVSAVMAKSFSSLNVDASFSEAFRWNVEYIMRNVPGASMFVLEPVITTATHSNIIAPQQSYFDAMEKICNALSVPYFKAGKQSRISAATAALYFADGIHPNDAGHREIARAVYNSAKGFIEF